MKKWLFLDKNHGLPLWKNVNFSIFWTSCFYSQERLLFALEYRKRHSSGLYCLKKKVEKMAIFGPKPWVTPLNKCQFFNFWTSCFYSQERLLFAIEYRKRHFPGLYCSKIKVGKMAIFGTKPWVNPLGKMSIIRLFGLLVFIA